MLAALLAALTSHRRRGRQARPVQACSPLTPLLPALACTLLPAGTACAQPNLAGWLLPLSPRHCLGWPPSLPCRLQLYVSYRELLFFVVCLHCQWTTRLLGGPAAASCTAAAHAEVPFLWPAEAAVPQPSAGTCGGPQQRPARLPPARCPCECCRCERCCWAAHPGAAPHPCFQNPQPCTARSTR